MIHELRQLRFYAVVIGLVACLFRIGQVLWVQGYLGGYR